MEFLHFAQELPDLVGLGLAVAVLEVEGTRGLRMLVSGVAAAGAVMPVAKGFHNLAEVRKAHVLRVLQQSFVKLASRHVFMARCAFGIAAAEHTAGRRGESMDRSRQQGHAIWPFQGGEIHGERGSQGVALG